MVEMEGEHVRNIFILRVDYDMTWICISMYPLISLQKKIRADIVVEEEFGGSADDGWRVLKGPPVGAPCIIPETPLDPKRFKECKKMLDAPSGALYR